VVHGALDATVILEQLHGVTATASRAVEEVVAPTDSADPAALAVKCSFGRVVVKEFADAAVVLPELGATALALRGDVLLMLAARTLHPFHGKTIHRVRLLWVWTALVFDFIVTPAALPADAAHRGDQTVPLKRTNEGFERNPEEREEGIGAWAKPRWAGAPGGARLAATIEDMRGTLSTERGFGGEGHPKQLVAA
jgi:hypothetical protein